MEESALENDEVIEQDGILFLIHESSKPYFNQVKIDYVKSLFGGRFIVLER
ncbi:iron-sulfur cluster biosynthesis family protein [Bacillus sp. SCS-153A]|uniref:iron-sulfur cluster biosynthesis family protein n=1 Tax=Rossellomorea sedimentorum TaxID=3115294 RepID=UPI0039062B47